MSEHSAKRRKWLSAALGTVAGLAALGWGLKLGLRREEAAQAPSAPVSEAAQAFWTAEFERPEGGELLRVASLRGQPLLVNFWATWCAPCVKELPDIAQFQREFAPLGWRVLGLAVDAPTPVREFLKKLQLDFPQGMAGLTGTTLAGTLGNTQGGLPFTVAFDAQGEILWRKLGATTLDELRQLPLKIKH